MKNQKNRQQDESRKCASSQSFVTQIHHLVSDTYVKHSRVNTLIWRLEPYFKQMTFTIAT